MLSKQPVAVFLDSEPAMLRAIKRALHDLERDWTLHYTVSPTEALRLLRENAPWVVLVDSETLHSDFGFRTELESLSTPAIRIMLTAYSDEKSLLYGTQNAHFVLAKPFEPRALIKLLDTVVRLHSFEMSDQLRSCLNALDVLPVLPTYYHKIREELDEEHPDVGKIAQMINEQPQVITKLLQIANSAFFGYPRAATTAQEVVMRLGLDLVQALVLFSGIFKSDEDQEDARKVEAIGKEGLALCETLGLIADRLDVNRRVRAEWILAGLVHNLGKLVYLRCENQGACNQKQPCQQEYEVLGAFLLTLWGFEKNLADAVLLQNSHHLLDDADQLTQVLHLARQLSGSANRESAFYGYTDPELSGLAKILLGDSG